MRLLKAIFWIGLVALFMPHSLSARHAAHNRSESFAASSDMPALAPSRWASSEENRASETADDFLATLRARLEALRVEIEDQQRARGRTHAVVSLTVR
jgi:hypothetical protein